MSGLPYFFVRRLACGRWCAEDKCADSLQLHGTAPELADKCAAAARRIGTWLAGVAT